MARFTTEDPEAGKDLTPPSLHRYLYAYANPTVYVDPTGRQSCGVCIALRYSKSTDERINILRDVANQDAALGTTVGVGIEIGKVVAAPVVLYADSLLASDGDAGARARWGKRWDGLKAFDARMRQAELKYGPGGAMAQMFVDFAEGIGEHAAQFEIANEKKDYIGRGQAGVRLVGDATAVAGGISGVRAVVGEVTAGISSASSEAAAIQANLERSMVNDLAHGFERGELASDTGVPPLSSASDFSAGSVPHKATRWREYQDAGGTWEYRRWSGVYDANMTRASAANEAADAYHQTLGWGRREVAVNATVDGIDYVRRLDIADVAAQRGVEYKTGYQTANHDNLWELARDQSLVESGWDIEWVFRDKASQPLQDAATNAGIKVKIGK